MKRTYRSLIIHISIWILLLVVSAVLLGAFNPQVSKGDNFNFAINYLYIWIVYVILYNLNYFIFIPKLLLKGRYFVYLIVVLVAIISISISIAEYNLVRYRMSLEQASLEETHRTDITTYKKSHNIRDFENQIRESYRAKYYNPFHINNLSTTSALTFILAIGIVLSLISKWRKRENVVSEIRRQKTESELAYLKQQINPHFLFNALNSIYSLVLTHSDQACDVILRLSNLLRYILYETDRDKVSLVDELTIMRDFIELQKLKCNDTSNISFTTKGDFDGLYIEPLIFISFIENAFKYGANSYDKSYIDISIEYDERNNLLYFHTENTTVNIKKKNEFSGGIGIKNVSRRLDIIYEGNYTMNITNENNIFNVKIILPITKKQPKDEK